MIDLRSDTLTLPTPEMLAVVPSARFGDSGRWGADRRGEPALGDAEHHGEHPAADPVWDSSEALLAAHAGGAGR